MSSDESKSFRKAANLYSSINSIALKSKTSSFETTHESKDQFAN